MLSSGYTTEESAQAIGYALTATTTGVAEEEYVGITLVSETRPTVKVELKLDETSNPRRDAILKLANGGELLHCVTRNGKRVDLLIPFPPEERAKGVLTAIALVEDDL